MRKTILTLISLEIDRYIFGIVPLLHEVKAFKRYLPYHCHDNGQMLSIGRVQIYSRDVGVCCQCWGRQGRSFATNALCVKTMPTYTFGNMLKCILQSSYSTLPITILYKLTLLIFVLGHLPHCIPWRQMRQFSVDALLSVLCLEGGADNVIEGFVRHSTLSTVTETSRCSSRVSVTSLHAWRGRITMSLSEALIPLFSWTTGVNSMAERNKCCLSQVRPFISHLAFDVEYLSSHSNNSHVQRQWRSSLLLHCWIKYAMTPTAQFT